VTAARCECERDGALLTRRAADRDDARSSTVVVVVVVVVVASSPVAAAVHRTLFDVIGTRRCLVTSLIFCYSICCSPSPSRVFASQQMTTVNYLVYIICMVSVDDVK